MSSFNLILKDTLVLLIVCQLVLFLLGWSSFDAEKKRDAGSGQTNITVVR